MESDKHGYWQYEDKEIDEHVGDWDGEVEGAFVDAFPLFQGLPEFVDRCAAEHLDKHKGDQVAPSDEEDGICTVAEGLGGVEAQIEHADCDLWEGDGRHSHHDGGSPQL